MSGVIFKMTFKHPNLKDTTSKNICHVNYIATRPGVDKTLTEADLQKELQKGVENFSSDDETYIKYIDERPRSHGLFSQNGIEDPEEVQKVIANVESFVWRGIVSLKEEDAKELNYLAKEKWQDMLRKTMPDVATEMKIELKNLRWVGAVNMEKGHPHAHVMIWENEPVRKMGIIHSTNLNQIRKIFTDEIFEDQRFQLLNEKNNMRDLTKDLAQKNVSDAVALLKENRLTGRELIDLFNGIDREGIAPRLFNEQEKVIAEKLNILASQLPGKGRVALKFMPENIKAEVGAIADYLLKQPLMAASLETNLKSVEELTRMYTGKDEAIQKARDNAYKDIRDRISQVILKGAVESQRDNVFGVNQDLSIKAVNFIKTIDSKINLVPEQTKVLNEVAIIMGRTGHSDEQIIKRLKDFSEKEALNYPEESIADIVKQIRENSADKQDLNSLSTPKKLDFYLSGLKVAGHTEKEAFQIIQETIKENSKGLDEDLKGLKEDDYLEKNGAQYTLTKKGITEFLQVKDLDPSEKYIFKILEKNGEEIPKTTFTELLDNKDVFGSLRNKDPNEFVVGKFDLKIRTEFGENNKLTFEELEKAIYEKYTDEGLNTNIEKAETELDILKNRIGKLTLNGYVSLEKDTGVYSFTEEGLEALTNVSNKMEFTRYDANVTLGYLDKAADGLLTVSQLREMLLSEITNKTANTYLERFTEMLDTEQFEKVKQYISIDDSGVITSTKEGRSLGFDLQKINSYFYKAKGHLTEDILKKICIKEFGPDNADQKYLDISHRIQTQVEKGHIEKDQASGAYKVIPLITDVNRLIYQVYKEGGSLNKADLKDVLNKNVVNKDAEKQFNYLVKRLENLKKEGYLEGQDKGYKLTIKGLEKRADLLIPERDLLRGKLSYLERLGLIENTENGYQCTQTYYKFMKEIAVDKESNHERTSDVLTKDIVQLIDRTQDKVNVGKIQRTHERMAIGKYINGEYKDIKTDYQSVRTYGAIPDTVAKTIGNLSTALFVAGLDLEEAREIIQEWNLKSNSNIDPEKLHEIINKVHSVFAENDLWGKTTVISSKDWKAMFESLGVDEKDQPKWIYKGENWQSVNHGAGLGSIISDIWKSAWRELERERMQTVAQAEMMKRQLAKQLGNQSIEAMKEQSKKSKDRSSMYRDDELEM